MKISISSGDPLIGSNRALAVNWFFCLGFIWGGGEGGGAYLCFLFESQAEMTIFCQ